MKTIVVLPTFSEIDNLATVVSRIWNICPMLDIVIVDDSSPDGTAALADQLHRQHPDRLFVMHRGEREGLGKAYLDAFRSLAVEHYEAVIQMDADLSHDPLYLPEFLTAIESADLVLGSRYTNGISVVNWNWKRLLLSKAANHFVHLVTGMPFTDVTSGYKCWRSSLLKALVSERVTASGYLFQIEMTWRAWSKRCTVCEVPIVFYERQCGRSKMDLHIVIEAIIGVCRLRLCSIYRTINDMLSSVIGGHSKRTA